MIIFDEQGKEIQYGRDTRYFEFNSSEIPEWINLPESVLLTPEDKIIIENEIRTQTFYIEKIDCIRFKLSNLTNLNSQSIFKMANEDDSEIVEIKDTLDNEQVSIYINDVLVDDLPEKIKFRGTTNFTRPKNFEVVFFPLSKKIYLLHNGYVVYKYNIDVDTSKRFYFSFANNQFIISSVKVEIQLSC